MDQTSHFTELHYVQTDLTKSPIKNSGILLKSSLKNRLLYEPFVLMCIMGICMDEYNIRGDPDYLTYLI